MSMIHVFAAIQLRQNAIKREFTVVDRIGYNQIKLCKYLGEIDEARVLMKELTVKRTKMPPAP
jgi:hypothetical protein